MRILCIPYSHTFSHLARPLAVGAELLRRGHEVAFAGSSDKLKHAKEAGFAVHPLFEVDPHTLYGNIRAGKLRFVSDSDLEGMVEADLELMRRFRPDVVLTDGRFSAQISSQLLGIRHAAIVNVSSTAYRAQPYIPMFDRIPQAVAPDASTLRGWLDVLNLNLEMTVFDTVMSSFSRWTRKHALSRKVTATNCLAGVDLTLMADIPEYFPTRNLPPDHHYVGPITWSLKGPEPVGWNPGTHGGPCLYVTMGTTGIPEFFPLLVDLLQREGVGAVISTGGQVKGLLSPDPAIWIGEFVDGDIVLPQCDVVVCHGGNGTIYQALQHGKPLVGMPSIPDQAFNMRRVEALHVGRTLAWKDFQHRPSSIIDEVRKILDTPDYSAAAAGLQAKLARYDAPVVSADLIEGLMTQQAATQLH